MEYSEDYQLSRDIDWFFQYNGVYFHVASNGHLLPTKSNNDNGNDTFFVDQNKNAELQCNIEKIIHNSHKEKQKIVVRDNPRGLNYSTFIEFAKIGFVSLDTIDDNYGCSKNMQVIARPKVFKELELDERYKLHIKHLNPSELEIGIQDFDGNEFPLE